MTPQYLKKYSNTIQILYYLACAPILKNKSSDRNGKAVTPKGFFFKIK